MNIPLRAIAVIAGLSLLASFAAAQPIPVYAEGGYANAHSVVAGGTIAFHISTSNSPFSVQIVNMANASTVLTTISSLTSTVRDCTGMWENGCAWPVTTQFTVPSNWTPGYYAAKFPTSRGTRNILFVVRSATPGSYSPIVVVQPTNTYVAYNTYTGKCVYDSLSTNNQRAKIVSLDRPYEEDAGLSRYRTWEQPFVDWMKSEGRSFEVITDDDLDAGLSLSAYKAVLLVGHSEYWTLAAREYLEAFHAAGGHIAVFAGNSIWWQARLDPQNRQMTVYKSASLDPKRGVDDDVVTVNWFDWPVLHPENLLLGASFRNAGYANRTANGFDGLPTNQRTPYTVTNASSWVFDQTGVTNGSLIAQASAGIETDGALFNTMPDGTLAVEGSDGTPLSYDILATLPASDGYATIGLVTNPQGGAVFNTGTRDWTRGLATDAVVQQMTRNVLDRFATGAPFAYAPRVTPNRVEDRFN
ncbi:MAG TPA: N,N-dimethylformamidase beta subunit family domain-containing protein, partial [Thermoanaerobaculia bacterium]|nr:N,N-dimethylformamidase beta subunit family domain-containing protein [Thermoanaerobaculia bacterium]